MTAAPRHEQPSSLAARLAQVERLLGEQREDIRAQHEEIALLRVVARSVPPLQSRPEAPIMPNDVADATVRAAPAAPSQRPTRSTRSRRALLKLGGAAAAAGVAAVTAGASERIAHATPALNGDPITAGQLTTASSPTTLQAVSGSTPNTVLNVDGIASGSADTNGIVSAGSGRGFGVWGTSNGTGVAVYATSALGCGVVGNTGGTGVAGVRGESNTSIGVIGDSGGSEAGVYGVNSTTGPGVVAVSQSGVDLVARGTGRLQQILQAIVGAPTGGSYNAGEQIRDGTGNLYICVASGNPGTWIRLCGPQAGVPGGALNYLAAPIRIFDSRGGQPAPLPVTKAPLATLSTTTIQVTGTTVGGLSVPAGATGIFGNLTVTNPVEIGDLILWPHGASQPLTSNINYVGGQTVANAINIGLSSGGAIDLFVHGNTTDVIIDVAGYAM